MMLTRWRNQPLQPVSERPIFSLWEDMDRLFEEVAKGVPTSSLTRENRTAAFSPRLDIAEEKNRYTVTAELPGLDEKNVEISYDDGFLTLKGEKKTEMESQETHYHRIERSFGSFERTIQLPQEVESEKIEARFKQGVLTVFLPKAKVIEKAAKKIQIKSD